MDLAKMNTVELTELRDKINQKIKARAVESSEDYLLLAVVPVVLTNAGGSWILN